LTSSPLKGSSFIVGNYQLIKELIHQQQAENKLSEKSHLIILSRDFKYQLTKSLPPLPFLHHPFAF
jgi:hypothetical protein